MPKRQRTSGPRPSSKPDSKGRASRPEPDEKPALIFIGEYVPGPHSAPTSIVDHHHYPGRNRNFPTLITWTDPEGRLHIPPDPPLREGIYPPWMRAPGEYPRQRPLRKCPSKECFKARSCVAPHDGKYCQKTHMSADANRDGLARRIAALRRQYAKPTLPVAEADEGRRLRQLKHELEQAWARKWNEALFDSQWQWIEAEKRRYASARAAKRRSAKREA